MGGQSLSSMWITGESNGFPRPFGPYLLLAGFAQGGMGELTLAMNGSIAGAFRLCVVKKLRADLTNDKEYVNRFIDEAKVVVQLNHANISHVFDIGRIEGQYYLAMEYVSGISVKRLMSRAEELGTTIPEDLALYIARGVLDALDYAHQHSHPISGEPLHVVHRDVSPQNVLVSWAGEVKLIDFGLALSAMKDEHTATGAVMGKIAYMPPEQARGEEVGPACDQFAAAIVTYEMLVGDRYHGELPMHGIWAIAGMGNFPPPKWSTLPRELQIILERALRNDPFGRYPTCGDLREALGAYMAAHHSATSGRQLRDVLETWFKDYRAEERELLAQFKEVTGSKIREAVKNSASAAESLTSGTHQRPQGWRMPPTESDARSLSGPGIGASPSTGASSAGLGDASTGSVGALPEESRSLRFMPPPSALGSTKSVVAAATELLAPPTTSTEQILVSPAGSGGPAATQSRAPAVAGPASLRAAASAASMPPTKSGSNDATERLPRTTRTKDDDELDFDPGRHRPVWPWAVIATGALAGVLIAVANREPAPVPSGTPAAPLVDTAPTSPTAVALPSVPAGAAGPTPPLPELVPAAELQVAPVAAVAPPEGSTPSTAGRITGKAVAALKGSRNRGGKATPVARAALVEPEAAPPEAAPPEDREARRAREHIDALRRSSCQDPCVARIVGQLETTPGAVELDGFRKSVSACVQACL
ncbi:MAG: protein kinase [Deltaproteobacteria bacterium]|nr:protein kinase [Deltaproteobacteria bacterium]